MNASLDALVAGAETWELDGETYTLGKLTFADHAAITKRILSKRGDPTEVASCLLKICDPSERKDILAKAYDDSTRIQQVTPKEFDDFTNSREGYVLATWLSLRKHHPDITEVEAATLIEKKAEETLALIVVEMQKTMADATPEQIAAVVASSEDGVFGQIITELMGLPVGNLPSPAKTLGTTSTDPSIGSVNGSAPSQSDTVTHTTPLVE